MKTIKILIMILFVQLLQLPYSNSEHNTWYIGNKLGFSQYHNIITYYVKKMTVYDNINDAIYNSHIGLGTFIGYQNNQYFNFELGYTWLGEIKYANNEINSTFKVQYIDIITKLHHPIINNKTNIYTKLGAAIWYANVKNTYIVNNKDIYSVYTNDTCISPILNFGIEYTIKTNWRTRLEYQKLTNIGNINTIGAKSNHSMVNLNILYFFT